MNLSQMKSHRQSVEAIDLQSAAFKIEPEATWQRLHERGPVVTTRIPLLGRVALTTRYLESSIVLRDTERFTLDGKQVGHKQSAGMRWWVPGVLRPLANNLLTLEGSDHRALRQRVDYAFRRVRLEQLRPRIDQIAQQRVVEFTRQLQQQGQADFVTTVSRPMPQQVISRLLGFNLHCSEADGVNADITIADHSHGKTLQGNAYEGKTDNKLNQSLLRLGSIRNGYDLIRALPAIRTITQTLRQEITLRRHSPREDLLSELISTDGDGRALTEDELLAMVFLLYVAGHETTTHLMSLSLWTLLNGTVPRVQEHLPMSDKSIGELLRYTSPVQMTKPRFALHDQQLGNAFIKRGETVAALVGAVNRDADWIENPDTLQLDRTPLRHLGFGAGAHVCLGMHLALLETRTVINALLMQHPNIALHPSTDVSWSKRTGLRAIESMLIVNAS